MAARDRFEIDLHCVKCGASGTAQVSEEDHPWARSPGFSIDDLPVTFRVTKASEFRQKTQIICVACNHIVHPPTSTVTKPKS